MNKLFRTGVVLSLVAFGLLTACTTETFDPESLASSTDATEDEDLASTADELGACRCDNCVLYAKCRQPRLPNGLFTFADKMARVNSQRPRVGCVAVIWTGSAWGHVAYVAGINGSRIRIDEGNYEGRCNTRTGTRESLGIRGYICP